MPRDQEGCWRFAVALVVVVVTTAITMPAYAQTGDTNKMNHLNEEGFNEFRAGRYQEAAAKFRAAYEAFPDPNLRKNEAVAWFKANRCDNAVPAANAFLMAPNIGDGDRLEARSILANCRVEMARTSLKSGNLELAETLLDEAESLEPDQYARDQIAIARVELAQRNAGGSNSGRPSPLGWVMVATGAAIVGGTMAYWLLTIPDRDASRNLSPSDPDYDAAAKRARTSRWLVPLGVVGGGAIAGVGVYLVVAGGDGGKGTPSNATAGLWYRW